MVEDERTSVNRRTADHGGRLSRLDDTQRVRELVLAVAFLGLLVVQSTHQAEYVIRLLQRDVFNNPTANGLLGQFLDLEPLDLAYNLAFFLLLLLVYRSSNAHYPGRWTRGMPAWWLLTMALAIEGYHLVEHLFKIWQFIDTRREGMPGILGDSLNLTWLHFALNTTSYLAVVAAFWLGGYYRHLKADLAALWAEIVGSTSVGRTAPGLPTLSRRGLFIGAVGIAAALGAARVGIRAWRPPIEMPTFADATRSAGIDFRHREHFLLEPAQAGAAFFDYDGDGRPDIFLTNGSGPNALYRNNGDGTFADVTAKADLADPDEVAIGVACADYNNDGNCDLLVTTLEGPKLFRNNGDGTFTDVTKPARLHGYHGHPTSVAWTDFDGDGYLDLYVAYWFNLFPKPIHDPSLAAFRDSKRPEHRSHVLFKNNGDGTFTDVTEYLDPRPRHGTGLAVGFFDYDDDGRPDLYVVNDFGQYRGPNTLYHNAGPVGDGWAFTDVSRQAGARAEMDGMGLAVGDYDGDGRLDMYMTNRGSNLLYRNRGDGTFEESTGSAGVGRGEVGGEYSVGWGNAFLDFDNDGLLDLYFVAGNIYPKANVNGDYRPDQPNALFHNRGAGKFRDVSAITGTDHTGVARGLAVADYDGDGFLDLLVANIDQPPVLLRNSGNDNHWLAVQLVGKRSNRDGVGARLALTAGGRRQVREIHSGTSFLSQHSLVAHFGLGRLDRADELQIRWPSGVVQTLTNLVVDRKITVTEAV